MPDPKPLEEAREWLRYAADDLETSEILLAHRQPKLNQALYFAQQATEKALKGFLVYHGRRYPLTHNLTTLRELCAELDPTLTDVVRPALWLSQFAMGMRYPGAPDLPNLAEAREWLSAAAEVCAAIRQRIGA